MLTNKNKIAYLFPFSTPLILIEKHFSFDSELECRLMLHIPTWKVGGKPAEGDGV